MRWTATAIILLGVALAAPARAQVCSASDLAAAVDAAGASLRKYNNEAQPKIAERVERLRLKKGWSKEETEEKAFQYLEDAEVVELDGRSNDLMNKIDAMGRPEAGDKADCASLAAVKAAGAELLVVMKMKSDYTLAKLDHELGGAPSTPAAAAPQPVVPETPSVAEKPPTVEKPPTAEKPVPAEKPPAAAAERAAAPSKSALAEKPPAATKPAPAAAPPPAAREAQPARPADPGNWRTVTGPAPPSPTGPAVAVGPIPPEGPPLLAPDAMTADEGYTIEEIRDATKGFFGTISTNLATVLEHAFSVAGRPTAYVLGQEGGGAFLAGLRYGDGTLYMRQGGRSKVYWHGPSIGTDFGASGSRTLFLIYKLNNPDDMFRTFTGLDGSAYFVGGIGFTLMKGGSVVLAPIRTGLGFRIGANLGYVRFTPRATWNPF